MADKGLGFALPGEEPKNDSQSAASSDAGTSASEGLEKVDFSGMTSQQLQEYDAIHGSYRRLLGDKPITWFWLLNHYSKANADAYRLQREARRNKGASGNAPEKKLKKKDKKQDPKENAAGYKEVEDESAAVPEEVKIPAADRRADIQEDYAGTVVLSASEDGSSKKTDMPKILCLGFDQLVGVTKIPFVIGRSEWDANLCIADNGAISSRHAQITERGGSYYITDMGSLNHVYVDGREIPPNVETLLEDGTKIRLADEEFVFKLK